MEEEAKVRVAVIKNNLKYRIPGFKGGESFVPKMGQIISLPKTLAKLEIDSRNVRNLLPEEKEFLAKKIAKKKKKKEKKA
jgi:hypothetical protein